MRKCFVYFVLLTLPCLRAQGLYSRHQLLDRELQSASDLSDDMVLKRTLFGAFHPDEASLADSGEMVAAAQRRLDRMQNLADRAKDLIAQGIYARNELIPIAEELEFRRRTLELAQSRARFIQEIADMAKAEQAADAARQQDDGPKPVEERFDGNGKFSSLMMRGVVLSYEKQFAKPMPISASGDTAIHRAMGYDHRGRVDVAVSPDSPEGIWLRQYLEKNQIPYYAFRSALAGRATAAHIHIGPPSLPLAAAD